MSEASFAEKPDVGVDITNRCNLFCRHCYNCSGEKPVKELALGELVSLFDQLEALGQNTLQVSGGEPTMHPNFPAIVREAMRRGMQVSINTNGMFGSAGREQLKRLRIHRIAVSLDGMRETNDWVRGNGVFDQVVSSIRFLKSICDDVLIATHIFRSNLGEVEQLVELAHKQRVAIKFSSLRPIGRAKKLMVGEVPSASEFRGVVETVSRLRRVYPDVLIKIDFDVLKPRAAHPVAPPALKAACPAGRSRLNVSYDGYIYPCSFLATLEREFAIGRLDDGPVLGLWRNSPILEQFRTIEKDQRCQSCSAYGNECVGGCAAMAYFSGGRLDAPDPICFIEPVPKKESGTTL